MNVLSLIIFILSNYIMVFQYQNPFSQTKIDTIKICQKITIKRFIYIHIDDRVWSIIGLIHILIFISNHKFLEGWDVELFLPNTFTHFTQEYSHRHSIHYDFHKSGRRSTQIDHHKKFKSKIIHSTQFALHRCTSVIQNKYFNLSSV